MAGENTGMDQRVLQRLSVKNLLSFGPEGVDIELRPLNVLIGPNASGKSNFIAALDLLRSSTRDWASLIRDGGGISEWLWKGTDRTPVATITAEVSGPPPMPLRHEIQLGALGAYPEVMGERVVSLPEESAIYTNDPSVLPNDVILQPEGGGRRGMAALPREDIGRGLSILSQVRDPVQYRSLALLASIYDRTRIYQDWSLGRGSALRLPQQADLRGDFLVEDASNLSLVVHSLLNKIGGKGLLLKHLGEFCPEFEDIGTDLIAGTMQIFVRERGLRTPTTSTRLSDGTLRYLCLLAILCHPDPPPLICIEEPEVGLHPDMIHHVAELLQEASQRTQIIVTTHSDLLVSAFTETPEAVIVCERDQDGTHMRRLEADKLKTWLGEYRLGEAWLSGALGGTRW